MTNFNILPEEFFNSYNELVFKRGMGFYRFKPEELQTLNLNYHDTANHRLVGHIENEFTIEDQSQLEYLTSPVVQGFDENFFEEHKRMYYAYGPTIGTPKLSDAWINRQKRGEFNPIHKHSGIYSFVIWLDIPYTKAEEDAASPYKGDGDNVSGCFQYIIPGKDGTTTLDVDKKWNGVMSVFPANTPHQVYPFYSTDKERITIAGNYNYSGFI